MKCPHVNATRHNLWLVNIGSDNGLVPSDNLQAIVWANTHPVLCRHMAPLDASELIIVNYQMLVKEDICLQYLLLTDINWD